MLDQKPILELIEEGKTVVGMRLDDDSWLASIPAVPGWYFIETNTPPKVFRAVDPPEEEGYDNIPAQATAVLAYRYFGVCVLPTEKNPSYIVCAGETKNLKARAKTHMYGHPKAGGLALAAYPVLRNFGWRFLFSLCDFSEIPNESKLLRIAGIELWRSQYGWPILCGLPQKYL